MSKMLLQSHLRRRPDNVVTLLCCRMPALRQMSSTTAASDRLVGHSPMAPAGIVNPNSTYIPTQQDVTTSGGVWAPTSAKRDALAELKTAAPLQTLDDQATPDEQLDLFLVDGLRLIAACTEQQTTNSAIGITTTNVVAQPPPPTMNQLQWQEWLGDWQRSLSDRLSMFPPEDCLRDVRDYLDAAVLEQKASGENSGSSSSSSSSSETQTSYNTPTATTKDTLLQVLTAEERQVQQDTERQVDQAVQRFRLLLAQEATQLLLDRWNILTEITDHDTDRAAVEGIDLVDSSSSQTLSGPALEKVLQAFLEGTPADRVDALWQLVDKDGDGLLDETEMNQVCELAVLPVGQALARLLDEALQQQPPTTRGVGWRQRRRDRAHRRRLTRMFHSTLQCHFRDEVEMAHRLRCIYAWSNKQHQDGRIKSVHVQQDKDSGSRQRYVELPPKIALTEFREVQREHFTHLDRVSQELWKSFREDLLIRQGKRRQRAELYRDCGLFLAAMAVGDYVLVLL